MTNPYLKQQDYKNINNNPNSVQNFGNFNSASLLKGALIGMVATYILTNPQAQQAIFKAVIRMQNLLQVGAEELKERFEDAKAEIEAGE